MASLPQSRQFLTSLINAISEIPLAHHQQPPSNRLQEPSNPLKSVPQSHRPLLATLHVLFPTLLLPALDLLDRRLVTRLQLVPHPKKQEHPDEASRHPRASSEALAGAPAEDDDDDNGPEGDEPAVSHGRAAPSPPRPPVAGPPASPSATPLLFLVRSSQPPPHPRRRKDGPPLGGATESATAAAATGQRVYVVRPRAWNCSCAAFAFAAFPGGGRWASGGGGAGGGEAGDPRVGADGGGVEEEGLGWSFGGMSLDGIGTGGEGVPCCKHLLACLLAERWKAGLGGYVEERRVGGNEMAGIVADI